MERGQLGIENRPITYFVFEELVAHLDRPRAEKISLRLHNWEQAVNAWSFNQQVCDYIYALVSRHNTPVEVITWRPIGFAEVVHNRLWAMDVPVSETHSSVYNSISQRIAIDSGVNLVYDPNPAHRFGYGFKAREFSIGQF